jgi:hypothetical protein
VCLPAGCLHQFLGRDTAGALEEINDSAVLLPSRSRLGFWTVLGALETQQGLDVRQDGASC